MKKFVFTERMRAHNDFVRKKKIAWGRKYESYQSVINVGVIKREMTSLNDDPNNNKQALH